MGQQFCWCVNCAQRCVLPGKTGRGGWKNWPSFSLPGNQVWHEGRWEEEMRRTKMERERWEGSIGSEVAFGSGGGPSKVHAGKVWMHFGVFCLALWGGMILRRDCSSRWQQISPSQEGKFEPELVFTRSCLCPITGVQKSQNRLGGTCEG